MKIKILLLFTFSCFLLGSLFAENTSSQLIKSKDGQMQIYLLIGQSNMAGRAPYNEEESGIVDRCYLLNDNDQLEPAQNPFNKYSTIRKDLDMQKMNPGYMFSKILLKNNKDLTIGLVVNARGGTSINEWAKGTQYYDEAVRRVKVAEQSGELKGILWHQGESDTKDLLYTDKLVQLIKDLRSDLGKSDLPFIAGEIYSNPNKPQTKEFNDRLLLLPSLIPNTVVVSSKNLTTIDGTHFDRESMLIFGQRYADALLFIINQK